MAMVDVNKRFDLIHIVTNMTKVQACWRAKIGKANIA